MLLNTERKYMRIIFTVPVLSFQQVSHMEQGLFRDTSHKMTFIHTFVHILLFLLIRDRFSISRDLPHSFIHRSHFFPDAFSAFGGI